MNMSRIEIFCRVIACSNSLKECPGTYKDLSNGNPPRGFYFLPECVNPKILVIGKNPGHAFQEEANLYKNQPLETIVSNHIEFISSLYERVDRFDSKEKRSTVFHHNLRRYLAYFLDAEKSEVFKHAVYTNLVKCSSPNEQGTLHKQTIKNCFTKHLQREINLFQPRVLLALGNEVFNYLNRVDVQIIHRCPLFKIKHPSYFYKKEHEAQILSDLKVRMRQYL